MKETFFIRSWIPSQSENQSHSTHTLTIYDNGDTQGFLLEDARGGCEWSLYKFESRGSTHDGYIQETGFLCEEIPLDFLSIESYPATIQKVKGSVRIFIPAWEVLVTTQLLDALDSPARSESCPPPSAPQASSPPQPSQRHISQQRPQPSSLRQPTPLSPASPAPGKSHCLKQGQSQQNERSKKSNGPKPTSSPSSNPTSPAQPKSPNPRMPVSHRPPPGAKKQTGRQLQPSLPPSSQPQPSPASQHPVIPSSESGKSTSASPVPTSS